MLNLAFSIKTFV